MNLKQSLLSYNTLYAKSHNLGKIQNQAFFSLNSEVIVVVYFKCLSSMQ